MAIQSIQEMYTDKIESVGTVKRIYFYCLVVNIDGTKEWHYFGIDPTEKLPTTGDPINEYTYVQFPQGLDDLDPIDANYFLFYLGRLAGFKREGLTQ